MMKKFKFTAFTVFRSSTKYILLLFVSWFAYGQSYSLAPKDLRVIQAEEMKNGMEQLGLSKDKINCHLRELDKIPDSVLMDMLEYHRKYKQLPDSWRVRMEAIGEKCPGKSISAKVSLSEATARQLETDEFRQLAKKNQFSDQYTRCLIHESDATPGRQVIADVEYRIKNGDPSVNNIKRIERIVQRCGSL